MQPYETLNDVPANILAAGDLLAYAGLNWPGYRISDVHIRIADALEAVERGAIDRLIITIPPRHGKTMLASEFFPSWYLGRNPDRFVIASTYSQERASDTGRKVRNMMTDTPFKYAFPGVEVTGDSKAAHRFSTNKGGAYYAVGANGPITGRGAHLFLIDDPIKNREQADSPTERAKQKDWFRSTAYTRLMPGGAIIIIMTPWHVDDLQGWALSELKDEGWHHLHLPAVAENNDALGRNPGEPLWPEQYDLAALKRIKSAIGSREWSALYQGRPVPQEGGMIELGWCPRYREPLAQYSQVVLSFDTAQKDKEINDPSVCAVFGLSDTFDDLLYVWRDRVKYPELKRIAYNLIEQWNPNAVLIEDKSSGQSLIQDLEVESRAPIVSIEPEGSKETRMSVETPAIEAGRLRLPYSAPWLIDFEAEVGTFPLSSTKDQVDALSQFLKWRREHGYFDLAPVSIHESRFATTRGRFS